VMNKFHSPTGRPQRNIWSPSWNFTRRGRLPSLYKMNFVTILVVGGPFLHCVRLFELLYTSWLKAGAIWPSSRLSTLNLMFNCT
jgi:hypothetical protein